MGTLESDRIVMMENHDEAYRVWKERGVRGRTLVHVDAHIDFGWVPDTDLGEIGSIDAAQGGALLNPYLTPREKLVSIGNYICPAMRDGIVDTFYWIVPDASWRSGRGRRRAIRFLRQACAVRQLAGAPVEVGRQYARCRVFGKEIIVTSLERLGRIEGPVLLDIDVDYLVTPRIEDDLNPARSPWITPDELHSRLVSRLGAIDLVTVAYSVEGGFTPLRYKHLGDDLRSLFAGETPAGDGAAAAREYRLSVDRLRTRGGDVEEAVRHYREALRHDTTYGTAYNNYGILYARYGKPARAEAEYRRFLQIDPENVEALNGLGHVVLGRGRRDEAERIFDRCIELDGKHFGARAGKAIALFRKGRIAEAAPVFEGLNRDAPESGAISWWLGRAAERRGVAEEAIRWYKDAAMRGSDGPVVHLRLARLYLARGNRFRAREELARFAHSLRHLI